MGQFKNHSIKAKVGWKVSRFGKKYRIPVKCKFQILLRVCQILHGSCILLGNLSTKNQKIEARRAQLQELSVQRRGPGTHLRSDMLLTCLTVSTETIHTALEDVLILHC